MCPSLSSPPVTSPICTGKPGDECPDGDAQGPPTDGSQHSLLKVAKWRKWSLFACSCLLQFLLQLDMASVAVALPRIAKDLVASQILVFTVATAYLLAQTVVQLVFSHISHGLGRRYAYLSGVSFYIIGGMIAATSPTAEQLIGARVVQGMGAAGMLTMSAIIVVDIMQPRQRAALSAISQAFGALGNICGPLLSGLLFQHFDWRSVFVMEVVIAVILLLALVALLRPWQTGREHTLQVLKGYDWIGMVFFLIGAVMCLISINVGGSIAPWNSPLVITCLVTGIGSLLALGFHQRLYAKNPAFPRAIFNKWVTNAAFLGSLVSGLLLSMVFYNLVLFWEGVRHQTTVEVGLMLLSVTLTYTIFAAVTGIVVKVQGQVRWASIAGTVCSATGLGLMYLLDDLIPVPPILVISGIAAAGCGIMIPAVINTVLASTDKEWHSHAIAMRMLLYTAGQCIGISVGVAIFTNKFEYHNARAGGTDDVLLTPQNLMGAIRGLPPDSAVIKPMILALRYVWGAGAITAFLTGLLLCSFKCPSLPKDKASGRGSDCAGSERQDEVKSRQDSRELQGMRIGASHRVPITRVSSSENVSGSRVAMKAAPGDAGAGHGE